MTAPLKDLRAKVTAETWCVIEARHRVTGEQHAEIVRGILHDWALAEMRKATVMQGLLKAEGIGGNVREL
ncbi:hypothetical protein CO615_04100 [Lysobacteraceae bacterium NML75-0749]|nr:hypothetical protein CO615_04100 [Xanthomonadaceae bacterium NML75-0749]